jgi:hypothetical protein
VCYTTNNQEQFEKGVTKIHLTDHAKVRVKERCGLPKKAIERNAAKALHCGVSHKECIGRLKKYVDFLFLSHNCGGKIRLYGNHVYIFTNTDTLVTVLPLPHGYRSAVSKIIQKKRGNDNGILDAKK